MSRIQIFIIKIVWLPPMPPALKGQWQLWSEQGSRRGSVGLLGCLAGWSRMLPRSLPGSSWEVLGVPWRPPGASPGGCWGGLGASRGPLGRSGGRPGAPGGDLGASWGLPGWIWGPLGGILGGSGGFLGASLDGSGGLLGRPGGLLGGSWAPRLAPWSSSWPI